MKVRMTLGRKIASGITLMLVLMVVVGIAGYYGLNSVLKELNFYNNMNLLQKNVLSAKSTTNLLMIASLKEQFELLDSYHKAFKSTINNSIAMVQGMRGRLKGEAAGMQTLDKLEQGLLAYGTIFEKYVESEKRKSGFAHDMFETSANMLAVTGQAQMWVETMDLKTKTTGSAFQTFTIRQDEASRQNFQKNLVELGAAVDDWYNKVERSDELRSAGDQIKELLSRYSDLSRRYFERVALQAELEQQMNVATERFSKQIGELNTMSTEKLQAQAAFSNLLIFGFIAAALFVGLVYGAYSIRSIVSNIKKVIDGVSQGSAQVAEGAEQVSKSSHQLASGVSEQAAALEELSANLKEILSMTRNNADNSKTAKEMMNEAGDVVKQVNRHMDDMAEAIEKINKSSKETGNIIKTIDEIAFQTNLLALNAAVEAARAGEAGAGFAVVADEVRNLAMRAAEAAKNTTELIEHTIKTVKNGHELTKVTQEAFQENVETAIKVTELVNEIAAASEEQAEGIGQLNNAVGDMDRVVQQNAAISEESSGAAGEMAGQAGQMKELIGEMEALVGQAERRSRTMKRGVPDIHPAEDRKSRMALLE